MKKPDNFNAGATRRNPLEDAINGNFSVPVEKPDEPEAKEENETRQNIREKFIVAFAQGERSIYKAFCAMKGVSMNHFALCAFDYFKEDIEKGKVELTVHGYKRKG
jgi:hypothetical protein